MSLTKKIIIYMIAGIILGVFFNEYINSEENIQGLIGDDNYQASVNFLNIYLIDGLFKVGGVIFISLLKMLVVPVVFCSLICGIVGIDDIKALGRTGLKTFVLYIATTAIAITVALVISVSFGLGQGGDFQADKVGEFAARQAPSLVDVITNIASNNMLASMAEGNMLQIIFVCMFLGIAIANSGKSGKAVAEGIAKFNDVIMVLVSMVMSLAPYGVFFLIAKTFSEQGFSTIAQLLEYFLVLSGILILHLTGTLSLLLSFFGINALKFMRKMRSVQVFAFSTASSNATIPVTMQAVTKRLGVSDKIASFTVPFGATINMDGTAIMQGVATVFIAGVYGYDLSIGDYLTVIGMSVLASIGTAGVPGVGLIMLSMVFLQVGLPVEGIALILGVDRLLDMIRTAVNVTGDAAVTTIVAKSEKQFDQKIFDDPDAGVEQPWHEHENAKK